MTTPDLRTALERLLHDLIEGKVLDGAIADARAALATPPPEPPSDEELQQLWLDLYAFHDGPTSGDVAEIARAVLERWGNG